MSCLFARTAVLQMVQTSPYQRKIRRENLKIWGLPVGKIFLYVYPIQNCNTPNLPRIFSPSVCHSSSYPCLSLPNDRLIQFSRLQSVRVPNLFLSDTRDIHFSPTIEVQILKLLITQSSLLSLYFFAVCSKASPQESVLEHPEPATVNLHQT